jgi:hypothetical protein
MLILLRILYFRTLSKGEFLMSYALNFNGTSSYVRVPYTALLTPTNISIMAIITKTKNAQQYIASKAQSGGYFFWISKDGYLSISVYIGGDYRTLHSQASLANGTYSVCCTYDGSYMRLYIDGELAAEQAQTGNIAYSVNNALMIGCDPGADSNPDPSAPYYYQGTINNIAIWNRGLSINEAKAMCGKSLSGEEPGLVAYYRTDEGSGTVLYDSSQSGINATIVNATWGEEFNIDSYVTYGENSCYYVSQQSGNDSNNGLSSASPIATLSRLCEILKPKQSETVTVYVAPGIYRCSPFFVGPDTEGGKIVIKGDSDCVNFPQCSPGLVRISGYDEDEKTPIEDIINNNYNLVSSIGEVQLENIEICSPCNGVSCSRLVNCKIWSGLIGAQDFVFAKNCEIYSGTTGLVGISTTESEAYNCICYSATNGFATTSCYHCFSISANISFTNCTSYNCIAQYSIKGFFGGTCYNCVASECESGFGSITGSDNGTKGCLSNKGNFITNNFCFNMILQNYLSMGLLDRGTEISETTDNDIYGLRRISNIIDIGPIENCNYEFEYNDVYSSAPAIKIYGSGQLALNFNAYARLNILKTIFVKFHIEEGADKPQVIIRGNNLNIVKTLTGNNDVWERVDINLLSPVDTTVSMILCTNDPSANSYAIFSDPI